MGRCSTRCDAGRPGALRAPTLASAIPALALALLSALPVLTLVSSTLYEGSPCFHEESQISGVCKLLPYCSWAVKERRSHLYPQTCSFVGYLPVVCCPYTRTHDPPHLPLRPARPFLMPAEVAALPAPMTGALPALPLQPADVESPLLPPPLEIGGPLGPLATSSSQRPGYRPPDGPDDLQQEAEGLMVPMADRIAVAAGPAGPTGFLGNLQLGDGSAGFAVRRPK